MIGLSLAGWRIDDVISGTPGLLLAAGFGLWRIFSVGLSKKFVTWHRGRLERQQLHLASCTDVRFHFENWITYALILGYLLQVASILSPTSSPHLQENFSVLSRSVQLLIRVGSNCHSRRPSSRALLHRSGEGG
jgi:hypothetical protein